MIRDVKVRVDVLRNGVKYISLPFSADNPPNIYADSLADIKASLRGEFINDSRVEWMTDRLRPVITINGVEYNYGIFLPGSISLNYYSYGQRINVEAYDKCYLLQLHRTESILHFDAGTNYLDAVGQLLIDAGIALILQTPTDKTLASAREDWDIGTDYLTIINQLLGEINYNSIYFNNEGYAVIEPYSNPSADKIDHTYNAEDIKSVTAPDYTIESDIFDTPNVFIGMCSNADLDTVLTATAENNNPMSSLSIARRGMRIAQTYQVDNIADQDALQAYVDKLCYESMLTGQEITIKTLIMPGHGILDTVALNCGGIQGICQETAWSFTLAAGEYMTHVLKKVVYA